MLKHTCIIAIILLIVNIQLACATSLAKDKSDVSVSSIFEGLGYSPVCVASALASCERFAKPDCYLHVLYLMPELKSLLQDIKCENKVISETENTNQIEQLIYISNKLLLQNLTDIFNRSATDEIKVLKNEFKTQEQEQNIAIKNIIENEDIFRNDLPIIKESVENVSFSNNIIINEMKLIHAELNSLKEKWNNDTLQEETKTNIEELKILIHDAKNISSEILSVHRNKPQHCAEASVPNGVITVYPNKINVFKAYVTFCDQTTDGGGWTVIQNRDSKVIRQDFNRSWSEYVEGFGDVEGEFWLGLDNIHALTELTPMELRVDLEDYDGVKKWAKYDTFKIGDASTKYVLTLGKYSGDAGDSLAYQNGMKFSTYDQGNDKWSNNCALSSRSGWWFDACKDANLNGYQYVGKYSVSNYDGIEWKNFHGSYNRSLKKASMKIRPKSRN